MLPFAALLPLGPMRGTVDPKPALLIYTDPEDNGGRVAWRREDVERRCKVVQVAVWSDGRVVWRDPSRRELVGGFKILRDVYFEARIAPQRVRAVVSGLDRRNVYGFGFTTPDGRGTPLTKIQVRGEGRWVTMGAVGAPPLKPPSASMAYWPRYRRLWGEAQRSIRGLVPNQGRRAEYPRVGAWIGA